MESQKNPGNVAGGHKANLANPNTSDESKEYSRQALEEIDYAGATKRPDASKNEHNVIGGHKATLSNPNTSEEAKEHSRQVLEDKDIF